MGNHTDQEQPKTWLGESIVVTFFFCAPFGIAAIIAARKVRSRFSNGDIDGANQAAKDAYRWTRNGFIAGVVFWLCLVIFLLLFW
jgi:Interferon-induced transmembrane protein